jgi:hypothetical protein
LSENWHSDGQKKVQLTLSQGKKKKKGDGVEDEDATQVKMKREEGYGRSHHAGQLGLTPLSYTSTIFL